MSDDVCFRLAILESDTKFFRLVENSMIGICSVATSTTHPSEKELSFDTLSVASGRSVVSCFVLFFQNMSEQEDKACTLFAVSRRRAK
jgi:hypothetical protein